MKAQEIIEKQVQNHQEMIQYYEKCIEKLKLDIFDLNQELEILNSVVPRLKFSKEQPK